MVSILLFRLIIGSLIILYAYHPDQSVLYSSDGKLQDSATDFWESVLSLDEVTDL
jgi:hypothetical protein